MKIFQKYQFEQLFIGLTALFGTELFALQL
jgi:hypothetical protein